MYWRSIIKDQGGMNVLEKYYKEPRRNEYLEKYYKESRRNECPGEVL